MASRSETRSVLLALFIGCVLAAAIVVGAKLVNLTNQIQQERIGQVYSFCVDQNRRNMDTIAALKKQKPNPQALIGVFQAAGVKITPEARSALARWQEQSTKAGQASTILLINALAPYRPNCKALANQAVH